MRASHPAELHVAAVLACAAAAMLLLGGCASPGPPRPPSLQLPEPVRDLSALREGNEVALHFTLPQRTTDDLPLRPPTVWATLCRGLKSTPCLPIPGKESQELSISEANGASRTITWHDKLPPSLTTGAARPLAYRLQLDNGRNRNAGWSASIYTLAGAAPPAVEDLQAEATSRGILLRWKTQPSTATSDRPATTDATTEVLLHREQIGAPPASADRPKAASASVWLETRANLAGAGGATGATAETLDASAQEAVPYRYVAVRRRIIVADSQRMEMRSTLSAPVEITLRDIFPPPVPAGLSAAGFTESNHFSIDLVWNPVNDPHLAGYNIMRQPIDANGSATAALQPLNARPLTLPAFHDATANPAQRYRYSVSSIDTHNNQSASASVVVEPSQSQ